MAAILPKHNHSEEMQALVGVLLTDGEAISSIRRWVNQAIRSTKVGAEVAGAGERSGFRIADRFDHIGDLQECVRELRAEDTSPRAIRLRVNRVLRGTAVPSDCPESRPRAPKTPGVVLGTGGAVP